MPRSNSPSCSHESSNYQCECDLRKLDSRVISEHAGAIWRSVAAAVFLLLIHGLFVFQCTGFDFVGFCASLESARISLSSVRHSTDSESRTKYVKPQSERCDVPLGRPLSSSLKGGLMASMGIIAHVFAPVLWQPGDQTWIRIFGEVLAIAILIYYGCIAILLLAQLCYLLMYVAYQSFLLGLQTGLCSFSLACTNDNRSEGFAANYLLFWVELSLWVVAWTALIIFLRHILFSDINPLSKFGTSSIILQLMIFTPRFISALNLSPASDYLAMDPIRGFARGVSHLVKTARETCKSSHDLQQLSPAEID